MGEANRMRGKYARIDRPDDSTPRPSLDAAYREPSDEEDLDEFDPLNYEEGTLRRRKYQKAGKDRSAAAGQIVRSLWRRWLIPSRTCFWIMLFLVASFILLLSAGGIWVWKLAPQDGQSPSWYPSPKGGSDAQWEVSYKKAAALVKQMTLVEKVNITSGIGWMMGMCVGNTGPVERLGFPSLCLQDGPLGIRFADNITAFPAGITVGATWNRDLMYKRGRAHALEARLKGVNVLLGPAMGPLGRAPAGGRNWEGFGSDPVLQGVAASQTIKGIQDEGVIATAKHYIGNEQEHFRQSWEWGTPNAISSNIDDRTLHELYAWPFAESVRAGVASIMCSYNQVNNSYACSNSKLMNGILKDELGFQGFVQSDWLAQRSGVASALAGLDVTMPGDGLRWQDGNSLWGSKLTEAVLNSSVPMERLNDMATRVVAAWYQLGQDDKSKWGEGPNFSSWTNDKVGFLHPGSDDKSIGTVNKFVDVQGKGDDFHGLLSRQIAAEGTVVLKNDGDILPLNRNGFENSGGAPAIKYRVGIFGEDSRVNKDGPNACADRGCNVGTLAMGWGSGAVELPYLIAPVDAIKKAFNKDTVYVADWPNQKLPTERQILEDQDLCIVFANADSGEGYLHADGVNGDRNDLYTAKGGDDLVKEVAEGCGKGSGSTVVVLHTVGPVILEKWIDIPGVKAVINANLPAQESGNALVDVLFGDINPSGRLPYTIAKKPEDYGPTSKILTFPNNPIPQQNFTEGLYIDYRYFDKNNIDPRYEFGFGLSYTKFSLSSLAIEPLSRRGPYKKTLLPAPRPDVTIQPPSYETTIQDPSTALFPEPFRKLKKYIYPYISDVKDIKNGKYPYPPGYDTPAQLSPAGGAQGGNPDLYTEQVVVEATISNDGQRGGQSVVQVYISYPDGYKDEETGDLVDFPVKVLRGFEKIEVAKGEKKEVKFKLTRKDLSYWCIGRQNWVMPTTGHFTISVGFSSRDLPLKGEF